MPVITLVQHDGSSTELDVPLGSSVMLAAVTAGVSGIVGECGGSAMCATCHVYVGEGAGKLAPMLATESEMLECTSSERLSNSRLSCQIFMTEDLAGLTLHLPETQ